MGENKHQKNKKKNYENQVINWWDQSKMKTENVRSKGMESSINNRFFFENINE